MKAMPNYDFSSGQSESLSEDWSWKKGGLSYNHGCPIIMVDVLTLNPERARSLGIKMLYLHLNRAALSPKYSHKYHHMKPVSQKENNNHNNNQVMIAFRLKGAQRGINFTRLRQNENWNTSKHVIPCWLMISPPGSIAAKHNILGQIIAVPLGSSNSVILNVSLQDKSMFHFSNFRKCFYCLFFLFIPWSKALKNCNLRLEMFWNPRFRSCVMTPLCQTKSKAKKKAKIQQRSKQMGLDQAALCWWSCLFHSWLVDFIELCICLLVSCFHVIYIHGYG